MAAGGANAGATGLLQPLAVLASPTVDYPVHAEDTPARVAGRFDLSLDDLAASVKGCSGIFRPEGPDLTIPDVPLIEVDRLVADLIRLARFNSISISGTSGIERS